MATVGVAILMVGAAFTLHDIRQRLAVGKLPGGKLRRAVGPVMIILGVILIFAGSSD